MGRRKNPLMHDLDGKVFGFLMVLRPLDEANTCGTKLYECRCMLCGSLTKVTRADLDRRRKMSCGSRECSQTVREYKKKRPALSLDYEGMIDCNGYASRYACSILEEMFCCTRGYCKFYKSKYEGE